MKKIVLSLSVLLVLSGLVGSVRAEKADRNKPMNVESDALRYDDLKQVSIFTGNVILTKGSILIRGSQIEVRQDPEGYQFGLVTGSPVSASSLRGPIVSSPSTAMIAASARPIPASIQGVRSSSV